MTLIAGLLVLEGLCLLSDGESYAASFCILFVRVLPVALCQNLCGASRFFSCMRGMSYLIFLSNLKRT